jgi:hypothetical protein
MKIFLLLAVFAVVPAAQELPKADPWANLKGQTAWIFLGLLDASNGTWATYPGFKIPGRPNVGVPPGRAMPAKGNHLIATHAMPLHIVGFKNTGESMRLHAPLGKFILDEDKTGGVLEPGSRVIVQEVRRGRGNECDRACDVWARVTPE